MLYQAADVSRAAVSCAADVRSFGCCCYLVEVVSSDCRLMLGGLMVFKTGPDRKIGFAF